MSIEIGQGIELGHGVTMGDVPLGIAYFITENSDFLVTENNDNFIEET